MIYPNLERPLVIIEECYKKEYVTASDLVDILDCHPKTAERHMRRFEQMAHELTFLDVKRDNGKLYLRLNNES